MESREMILKNLFTGQQWRNRHREKTYGHGERGGEGEMYGVRWKLIFLKNDSFYLNLTLGN